jgi:serine/threonine protein kinase/tetratricopeptide (TPR) repeat protein
MNEEEIFHQALAQSPQERAAYVEQACAGDPALRAAVAALLRANVGATGFLEQPAPASVATVDEPVREGPGTVIGPYKLLENIGEGGFGVVFMAEQAQPVRRKVALKILKPGMDTKQVVARFEAERQALAIMDHPNIAKVFDGSATPSGRPYFVMELVRGVPITDFCDQNHLTPRQRLELFIPVCGAVQHAHQKGIIHRDLKPSNVLVSRHDTTPTVKVIDFGVAKALGQELTDKTLFTGLAQMVGTPLYMSPEQAGMSDLDIDTRSDIYSLGVLLYELLTGTTPFAKERFKKAAYDEIRRIIREEEPPRPSTRLSESKDSLPSISAQRQTEPAKLTKLVRGELDWIVMKALEKDRNRRYDTANGLAQDLHRYLANEPVEACPPSSWYRLRKFAHRNRAPLTVAAAVLVALGVGTGAVWQQRQEAVRERARAEANARQARQAVDRYYTRISESVLLHEPTLEPLRMQLLEDALQYYRDFARQDSGDPELLAEVAAANLRITNLYYALGNPEAWLPPMERATEAVEQLLQADARIPDSAGLRTGIMRPMAVALATPHPEQAMRVAARYCAAWEELVRREPTVPGYRNDLAVGYMLMTVVNLRRDEFVAAVTSAQRRSELLGGLVDAHNQAPHYRYGLALSRMLEAIARTGLGQIPAAEQAERQSLELARGLVAEFPAVSAYQELQRWALGINARNRERLGRLHDAEALRRQAIKIDEGLLEHYPTVPRYRSYVLTGYGFLADVLWAQGRQEEAGQAYRKAVAAAGEAETHDHQDDLAWLLATCRDPLIRDPDRAVSLATRVVERAPDDPSYLLTLGAAHYAQGNYQSAARALTQAADIPGPGTLGEGSHIWITLYQALAYGRLGERERAKAYYAEAVAQLNRGRWWDPDYRRLCAEAEQILGLPPHPDPWSSH